MDQEKQDRRIRSTRRRLRNALLDLLKIKRYRDISIQDITERADVARSTFYTHYMDKDDLLTGAEGIFAENLDHQMTAHPAGGGTSAFSARLWFEHVQAQGGILKIIARDPAMDLAMKTLRGIIHRSVQQGIPAHAGMSRASDIPLTVVVEYLTDTLMSLIQWWLKEGMKRTPEQMDEMFQQLVMPGATSVLHGYASEHL